MAGTAAVPAAQTGDEVSASRYLNDLTLDRLRENPGYFFRLIPSKMMSLLVPCITILMGAAVAFIVASVLVAMLSLNELVG